MNELTEKIVSGKITALEVGWQSKAFSAEKVREDASKLLEEDLPQHLQERIHHLLKIIAESGRVEYT